MKEEAFATGCPWGAEAAPLLARAEVHTGGSGPGRAGPGREVFMCGPARPASPSGVGTGGRQAGSPTIYGGQAGARLACGEREGAGIGPDAREPKPAGAVG